MTHFCANCGTEVEEDARFCPACGEPIETDAASELPPAPGWPDPTAEQPLADAPPQIPPTDPEPTDPEPAAAAGSGDGPAPVEPVQATDVGPVAPMTPPAAARAPVRPRAGAQGVTWPVTLSGWLIGVGAILAVLALFLPWVAFAERYTAGWGLASGVNILLLLLLLGVAATVFFATLVPRVPHLSLAILGVALVGFGIGLDRLSIGAAAFGAVLFALAMLAVSVGALLPETGHDRPLGGPQA
ncbi:MAG: zinc-ribbon domain-containing protein [Chloroflexota bacterium]|nr:zinc-ribbon domain-containing protein [Chloroflexota bacterium]